MSIQRISNVAGCTKFSEYYCVMLKLPAISIFIFVETILVHEILNLVKSKVQQKMNLLQIKSPNNFVEDI